MKSIKVDGQDVEAVYASPGRRSSMPAPVRARSSCTSTRTASSATTSATRRSTGRRTRHVELRETRDPIVHLREKLDLADDEFADARREVTGIVEAAVEFAKNGTDPAPEDALKNVYA